MACRATQIHQAAFCQQEDRVACRECVLVNLRFDVGVLDVRIVHQLVDLDFVVEMADVANDGLVFHLGHMFDGDDVAVTGGRNENVAFLDGFFHRCHFEAFHGGLQGANRIDLRDQDTGSVRAHGVGTAFPYVAISGYYHDFAGDHHVGSALDAVGQ